MAAQVVDSSTEAPVCWVCLDTVGTLISPCACPRQAHPHCLARWQLQNAGKDEERRCRFCQVELPRWQELLQEGNANASEPTVAIVVNGRSSRLQVPSGPDAEAQLRKSLARLCGRDDDGADLDVSFVCAAPTDGSKLRLSGMQACGAALHCASLSAGLRKSAAVLSTPAASTDSLPAPSSTSSLAAHTQRPRSISSAVSPSGSKLERTGQASICVGEQQFRPFEPMHTPASATSLSAQHAGMLAPQSAQRPDPSPTSSQTSGSPQPHSTCSDATAAWLDSLRHVPEMPAHKSQPGSSSAQSSQPAPSPSPADCLDSAPPSTGTLNQAHTPHMPAVDQASSDGAPRIVPEHRTSILTAASSSQTQATSRHGESGTAHAHAVSRHSRTASRPPTAVARPPLPSSRAAQLEALVTAHATPDLTHSGDDMADPVSALLRARRTGATGGTMAAGSPPRTSTPGNQLAPLAVPRGDPLGDPAASLQPQSQPQPQPCQQPESQQHLAPNSAASWSAGHPAQRQGRRRAPTCPCCTNWDPWDDVFSADAVMVSRTRTLTPPPILNASMSDVGSSNGPWAPGSAASDTVALHVGRVPASSSYYGWSHALTASGHVTVSSVSSTGSAYMGAQTPSLQQRPSFGLIPPASGSIAAAAWGSTPGHARATTAATQAYQSGTLLSASTIGTGAALTTPASVSTTASDGTPVSEPAAASVAATGVVQPDGKGGNAAGPGGHDDASAINTMQPVATAHQQQEQQQPELQPAELFCPAQVPLALPLLAATAQLPEQPPAIQYAQQAPQLRPLAEHEDEPGPDSLYAPSVPGGAPSPGLTARLPGTWHRGHQKAHSRRDMGPRLSPVPSRDVSAHGPSSSSIHGPAHAAPTGTATAITTAAPAGPGAIPSSTAPCLPTCQSAPPVVEPAATRPMPDAAHAAATSTSTPAPPVLNRPSRTLSAQSVGSAIARIIGLVSGTNSESGAATATELMDAPVAEGGSNHSRGSGTAAATAGNHHATWSHETVCAPREATQPQAAPIPTQQQSLTSSSAPSSWRMLGNMAACFRGGAPPFDDENEGSTVGTGEVGTEWEGPRSSPATGVQL